ncbi:MAG TPA: hypothetical protein VNA24_08785 [Hyalangium sp.]|nr:hypothetical protein [Hyalangium sp.]
MGMFLGFVGGQARAAPPAEAGQKSEAELIVWSGAKTREDAESQEIAFMGYSTALSDILMLEPAVLESSKVEGLKPGFFVVALGLCPKDKVEQPLRIFQALYPDVYTRTVKYQVTSETPALKCPELEEVTQDARDEPVLWKLKGAERLTQKGKVLVGLAFSYRWDEAGDFARSYFAVKTIYLLIDSKTRELVDSKVHEGPSDATKLESFKQEDERIVSSLEYGDPPCDPSGDYFKAWRREVKASIARKGIQLVEGKPKLFKEGSCGYAEEARMVTGEGRGD